MNILALDQATKKTGWSIYNNQDLILHGVISASSTDVCKRIIKISKEIEKLIDENKIDKVYMEEILLTDCGNNHSVFRSLSWLQGYLCIIFTIKNIEYEIIGASTWRSICGIGTGRGVKRDSLKSEDIKFVKSKYGIDVSDDEADAIGIGYAATHPKKLSAF